MLDAFFEVFLADTPESKKIHYHIRYKVYCEERGFEDKASFSNAMEKDEWDQDSIHFIARNKNTHEWIAAIRLVPHRNRKFPINKHCLFVPPSDILTYEAMEVSRLCIIKAFRWEEQPELNNTNMVQSARKQKVVQKTLKKEHQIKHALTLRLLQAAWKYSLEHNIKYWYFLTTGALARMLKRENIMLQPAGEACEHRGIRYPYIVILKKYEAKMLKLLNNPNNAKPFITGEKEKFYRTYSQLHSSEKKEYTSHV